MLVQQIAYSLEHTIGERMDTLWGATDPLHNYCTHSTRTHYTPPLYPLELTTAICIHTTPTVMLRKHGGGLMLPGSGAKTLSQLEQLQ